MKNSILFLLFFISSFFVIAQSPQNELSLENPKLNEYLQKQKPLRIQGKVLNATTDEIPVIYSVVTPFSELQSENILYANDDGTFEIILEPPFPYQQVWIAIDTFFYTGAMVHSDLMIEVDAKYLIENNGGQYLGKGIKYSGSDGDLNTYLNQHLVFQKKENRKVQKAFRKIKRDRKMPYKDFIVAYDSLYKSLFDLDKAFILKNPSEYSWIIENERMSDYLSNIIVKHWGKEMDQATWEKVNKHQSFLISNDGMSFYNYLMTYCKNSKSLDNKLVWNNFKTYSAINEEGMVLIDSMNYFESMIAEKATYDRLAFRRVRKKAYTFFMDTITEINTKATLAFLDQNFAPAKADFLKMKFENKDLKTKQKIFDMVFKTMKTEWCQQVLKSEYDKNKIKIEEINKTLSQSSTIKNSLNIGIPIGEMPFGAKMYHLKEGTGDELLQSLKNAFEGKALLLDFWATWCGPCIAEMPSSKKLQEQTNDLPLEFIYLSTSSGSDLEKWKNKVIELEQPGIHIFVDHAIISELMNKFMLSGYPSYAFINNKGIYKPGITRVSTLSTEKLSKMISSK